MQTARLRSPVVWLAALVAMAALRLCYVHLLWADEDYHLAAALQIMHGRIPYREFWYDKPPLAALYYTLIAAYPGWPLRILDTVFILSACALAYRLASVWWSEMEGRIAALLLVFFTTFYLPSAVIPFAVDALLLIPHLAAILFAKQRKPLLCGIACAIGLLVNTKAVFVVAVCAVWLIADLPLLALGMVVPLALAAAVGWLLGALPAFYLQVWQWGLLYAAGAAVPNALALDGRRLLDWFGFHAALFASVFAIRENRFKLLTWFGFSFLALTLGNHFAPRYFLQLLPVMVIAASHGIVFALQRWKRSAAIVLALLLLIPAVRFGPRYALLNKPNWADAALDLDSQRAAALIEALAKPGDTLFVWGYRPDIYVYTRLLPPGLFWDSQPLTGVPADRHLTVSQPVLAGPAAANRQELTRTRPTFIVDGLGLLNPALRPAAYPEIETWLAGYQLAGETKLSRIYRRK
jgi:hypothetical protein